MHPRPSQIQAVANTLILRTVTLTHTDTKDQEIKDIQTAQQKNGFKNRTINKPHRKERYNEDGSDKKKVTPSCLTSEDQRSKQAKASYETT